MRKACLLFLAVAIVSQTARAQSGRRLSTPAPPQPAVAAPARSGGAGGAPVVPPAANSSGLAFIPENLMSRDLHALKGGRFKLSDFAGKVLVVNLWATWCGPCRREMPEYEEVFREYAGRDVEFIALTTEDSQSSEERVRKFVREHKVSFRIGWADREMALTLMNGRNVIPQTFVIAGDGSVVRHFRGYAPVKSARALREALDLALEGR